MTSISSITPEEKLRNAKQYLLENNPSKITASNRHVILEEFVNQFDILFTPFKNETSGLTDSTRLLVVDSLSIWILRTSQMIQSKKVDTKEYQDIVCERLLNDTNATIIFQYAIHFWSDGTTTFVNALSDMFTKLLRLIRLLYPPTERDGLLSLWLNRTLEIPSTLRVQYYLIEALSNALDLSIVLQKRTDFIETSLSLMWSDSLCSPIGKCMTSLLANIFKIHFSENRDKLSEWLELWQGPTLRYMRDSRFGKSIELYVLTPLFKLMPHEAFILFSQKIETVQNPSIVLSILRLGQELGIEEEPFHESKLIGLESMEEYFSNDKYKLQAFELLTFSTKKSRPIHGYIFEMIKNNIDIFFVDTEVETRNYFCSAFKHFILRVRDSAYGLNRTVAKLKTANKFPEEQREKKAEIEKYKKFLIWLVRYLEIQICPGTQYQTNSAALITLENLVASGIDKDIKKRYIDTKNQREWPFSLSFCSNQYLVRLLLDCLSSHYDDIRQSAKGLLSIIFDSTLDTDLKKMFNWTKLNERSHEFLRSYQYADIGAILQSILCSTSENKEEFIGRLMIILESKTRQNTSNYVGHINEPINGYFNAMSLILRQEDLGSDYKKELIHRCIILIHENWKSVKNILCHDTSRESLPSFYAGFPEGDQMVITSAFKTVKDSSNLMTTLIQDPLLSDNQLVCLGNLLIEQLFSIYHSGAFQAILPSFQTCCRKCHEKNPSQIEIWLTNITDVLEHKTQYITRRSGGIPFMISTILSTETKKNHPLLKFAYERLEKIASQSIEYHQDEIDLPQINAFNCIRAIFIESKLSEPCTSYIPSALVLSLRNFTSDLWCLRNCSIMLFNSLQNRVFGKKGKNVGASQFFTRFQGVKDILLDILHNSIRSARTNNSDRGIHRVESIFLVLNILLRLRPTPGYDGLEPFKEEVVNCLKGENWKIRDMAARTLAHLQDSPIQWLTPVLNSITSTNQNFLHGVLLTAIATVQDLTIENLADQDISVFVDIIFAKRETLLLTNPNFITIKTYVNLVDAILQKCLVPLNDKRVICFTSSLGGFFLKNDNNFTVDGSKQLCLSAAINFLLVHDNASTIDICELGLRSNYFEVQLIALQYAVNNFDLSLSTYKNINAAISELFKVPVKLPSISALVTRALNKGNNISSLEITAILNDPLKSEAEKTAALECLGLITDTSYFAKIENSIFEYSRDEYPVNFRLAAVKCLANFSGLKKDINLVLRVFEMLNDDDEAIRIRASELLKSTLDEYQGVFRDSSPSGFTRCFDKVLFSLFPHEQIAPSIIQKLKDMLLSCQLFSSNKAVFQGLFESEKDNQYRNDLTQGLQYIRILSKTNSDYTCFQEWIEAIKNSLLKFLDSNEINDLPLGWASNPDIFCGLSVLRLLIKLLLPNQLESFDNCLLSHNVHELIYKIDCV